MQRSILRQHTSNSEIAEKIADGIGLNSKKPETETEMQEMVRNSLEVKADLYNQSEGHLNASDGIDCPVCRNKGFVEKVVFNGYYGSVMAECDCMKRRRSWQRLQKSGLAESINVLTFEAFKTEKDWQERMKKKAVEFSKGNGGSWFYVGGAVGCGKTHICTAICGELLRQNQSVKYMCWAEESVKLKGKVNDDNYGDLISIYKDCDVLYIDDFFKVARNSRSIAIPSDADIKLAYQIINFRYISKKKTVISSEWMIDELMGMDEATGSRIYEMSKGSTCQINRDKDRNYRYQPEA